MTHFIRISIIVVDKKRLLGFFTTFRNEPILVTQGMEND